MATLVEGLGVIADLVRRFSSELQDLASLNQAIQLLTSTVNNVVSPFSNAINASERFNQQILQSQIAFSIATLEVDSFGNEIVAFADRLDGSRDVFKNLAKDLEIETQTVVGLTSSRLNTVLNEVIQESASILGQYSNKYGQNSIEIFKKLTANLAATYSLLGSPEFQDPQETRALLLGRVNDPNAFVAQKLNISPGEVSEAKSKGEFIDLLIEKTESYRIASTLASDSLTNLTSNLQEISELIQRSFGEPLLKTFTELGGNIFNALNSTKKNTIVDIQRDTAKSILAIDKDIARNTEKIKYATTETETNEITRYINTLGKQREKIITQSNNKLLDLGVANPADLYKDLIDPQVRFEDRERKINLFESQNLREDTVVVGLVNYAKQFGLVLGDLFIQINNILNKIGGILENFNIDDLLKGFSIGFLDGIKDTINVAGTTINNVLGVINSLGSSLEGLIGVFVNFDAGNLLGYITGVGLSLKLLSDTTGIVTKGYLLLSQQTVLLAGAMAHLVRNSVILLGAGPLFTRFGAALAAFTALISTRIIPFLGLIGSKFVLLAGALGSILPYIAAAVVVLGAVYAGIMVFDKALNAISVGDGAINKFAAALQKATHWVLTFGGLLNQDKNKAAVAALKSSSLDSAQKTLDDFKIIGGKETFQKSLSRGGKQAKGIQDTFINSYNDINLLLNGTEKELRIAGKTEQEIKNIISARKDKEFIKDLEEKKSELERVYKDATGLELAGETTPIKTKSRDTFAAAAISNLRVAKSFTSPEGIEFKDDQAKQSDIENIKQSFELLSGNNLLGTESLNNYAETFLEISKNELLTAEQRNVFIALYEKAIQKELEITQGFIKASESILKSRQKAGELSPNEYETKQAETEVQKARAELNSTTKTNLVKTSLRNEDSLKAENEQKRILETSEQNIKKLPGLYELIREKERESSKVQLDQSIDLKLKNAFTSPRNNGRGKKIGAKLDKNKFTPQAITQFIQSEGLDAVANINSYLQAYSEVANSSPSKDIVKTTGSTGVRNFGERLANGEFQGYEILVKEFSSELGKTATITSSQYSKEATNLALKFIQGNKIGEDFKGLSPRQQKEFGTLINNSLRDLSSSKKFQDFNVNISKFVGEYKSQFEGEIEDLKKQIEQLSVEVIIDADTTPASDKLNKLLSEREEVKKKIELGTGTAADLNRAKELDVEILKEKTSATKKTISDRLEKSSLEKKNIESEIASLSGKSSPTPEDAKKIEELSKKLDEITERINRDTTLKTVLAEREQLITEASEKRSRLSEISEQKKTATPQELKELEREETLLSKRIDEINRLVNTNKLSDIENIKDRIAGNKELNELSDAQVMAKSQELLSAQKLLSIEKEIKAEREEQVRLSLNLLDSRNRLVDAQLKSAGTFSPELFQNEIAQAELDVQGNKYRNAENEFKISDKKLSQSFLQVGGENIKNLYEQISSEEPIINESAFIKQAESLSKKSFAGFKEAYDFVAESITKNSNIDKILNATSITEDVKKAYKEIFNQEISPDVNLDKLQEQLTRTKGAIVLENNNALNFGNLAANISTGDISFKDAINEAEKLGLSIDNISNSQELLIALTQKYGEELGSQEIINSLSGQKESIIKLKEEQLKYITLLETAISKTVEYSLEVSNRIRRETELKSIISNIGGDTGNSTLRLSQAINSYESSVEEFNARLKYENIENLQKLLKEKGFNFDISGLEKLSQIGGVSKKVLELAKNLQQVANELESAAFGRLDKIFADRTLAINTLNALGSINLGPNMDLTDAERSLLVLSEATDQAVAKLEAKIDFQNIRKSIIGLKESGTDYKIVIEDINNVVNSFKAQMEGAANVAFTRFEMASKSMSNQLNILNSLQQAYNSLSNAQNIYSNVVNKIAGEDINNLQQSLEKVQINQEVAKEYEELKSSGKTDLNTKRRLKTLADSSGISKREEIEGKIERIKNKQLEIERIQADTALKRQLIESKILELKNKQSRLELFAERAKIISQEDSPQKELELNTNSRLLDINELESNLLSQSTKLISNARALQKNNSTTTTVSNSFGSPSSSVSTRKNSSTLLNNNLGFAKTESKNLDSLLSEIDKAAKGFGLSDTESKNILDSLESQLKSITDRASEVLPDDLIQGVSEIKSTTPTEETNNILTQILETIKNFNISGTVPTTATAAVDTTDANAATSTSITPTTVPTKVDKNGKISLDYPDNNNNIIYERDEKGNITGGQGYFRVYTDEKGMPVITNQKAVDSPLFGDDFSNKNPIGSFDLDLREIGGATSGKEIRRIWGIDEEQIQREKINRINEELFKNSRANNYTVPEVSNSFNPEEIIRSIPNPQDSIEKILSGNKKNNSKGSSSFIKDEQSPESIIETGKSIIPKNENNLNNIESITSEISDALNSLVSPGSSAKGNIFSLESANNFFSNNTNNNNSNQDRNNININVTPPAQTSSQEYNIVNNNINNETITTNTNTNNTSNATSTSDNVQLVSILTSLLNATNTQTTVLNNAISGINIGNNIQTSTQVPTPSGTEFIIDNSPLSFISNSGVDTEQLTINSINRLNV